MLLSQFRTINLYEILYFLQTRMSHDSLILHAQTNTKDVCYLDVSIPPTLSSQYVRFQLFFLCEAEGNCPSQVMRNLELASDVLFMLLPFCCFTAVACV